MDQNMFHRRSVFIVIATILCVLVFAGRLFFLQVVKGDEYLLQSEKKLSRSITVKAPRGEILDRYGRPLVTNRTSFSLKIDSVPFRDTDKNAVLLSLASICNEHGNEYLDSLPVTKTPPFSYTYHIEENASAEKTVVNFLRKFDWSESTTAEELINLICEENEVPDDLSAQDKRTLAGIYYEMEQRPFNSTTPFLFAEDVGVPLVTEVKERSRELVGVMVDVDSVREYQTPYAAHVLGRVGIIYKEEYPEYRKKGYKMSDSVGKDGMERILESYLRGTDGTREIETTATGKVTGILSADNPQPGNNCVLTLDIKIQEAAEKSLARIVPKLRAEGSTNSRWGGENAKGAAMVVLDVRNGDTLALASYPTFSLADYNKNYNNMLNDPLRPMFNRAIGGTYPPGSTFKMVTSIAGLESGVINKNSIIDTKGIYTYYAPSYTPQCDVYKSYGRIHGPINVEQALQVSCNYFYYDIGRIMGIDTLASFAERMGFGAKTGIELPGERAGQVASRERTEKRGDIWYPGQTLAAAIGQSETLVSPIQLAQYTATIANGGTQYKPHLLKSVKNPLDNTTVYEQMAEVTATMGFNENNLKTIQSGMQMVAMVEGGSGYAVFKDYPVKVAAKTGSAQAPGGSHALFVAYAPADDPEIAVAIVVENGGQGSRVASCAKDIFDAYFASDFDLENRVGENTILK
ncbi:MAG: penicillin-binding protein 2 [Clostridia bacterium]|nr:penicillin-binding protein 2 [Clostridia bacterium]